MKKNLILALAALVTFGASLTSCGGWHSESVNNDTIVSTQLADSLCMSLGAFIGANLQEQMGKIENMDEFIEAYQLIVGHRYTPEQITAMNAAFYSLQQLVSMENAGIKVNRELFLQEFRKYLQNQNLTHEQISALFNKYQQTSAKVSAIIEKREAMRNGVNSTNDIVNSNNTSDPQENNTQQPDSTPSQLQGTDSASNQTVIEMSSVVEQAEETLVSNQQPQQTPKK